MFAAGCNDFDQLRTKYTRQRSILQMMEKWTSPADMKRLRKETLEPLGREIKELELARDSQ